MVIDFANTHELYIGRLVWNRQQFIKDPNTGRRQARPNPETKWNVEEVPHLRIIDDPLWTLVKDRQRDSRSRVMTKDKGIRFRTCPPTELPPLRSSQVWRLRWRVLEDQSIPLRLLHRPQQRNL